MTKQRSTKRALLLSALSLLMCVSMLIGSTFAWFTDSVTSGRNKIVAGNLDVVLEYKTSANGTWLPVTSDTKLFKEGALYEPGYTEVVFLRVSNAGNLALKYNLNVTVGSETTSTNVYGDTFSLKDYLEIGYYSMDESLGQYLLDAMFGTREAALSYVTTKKLSEDSGIIRENAPLTKGNAYSPLITALVLTMPETVGNEANHKTGVDAPSVELGVTLVATQLTEEKDSYNNQYDADAEYPVFADKWDGTVDTSWYNDTDTEFIIATAEQLAGLAELVDSGNTFAGKTIKLGTDLDLYHLADGATDPTCFDPIGSYRNDKEFMGTFDGQGHTVANINQNTWALNTGYSYGDLGLGLFSAVRDANIKNLVIDGASISGESGLVGVVAATAYGNCNFENITVKNTNANDYQYYAGGVVGWASGTHTYKGINIEETTTIGSQWGDFNNASGGIIGGAGTSGTYLMKDCTVACRIDGVNDVVSSYEWYSYRSCGMLIGNSGQKYDPDGDNVGEAIAPNLTCENVTVIYGDWANYHYCKFANMGKYPWVRVEAGVSVDAYSNVRYGHPTDANGNTVVDDSHVHGEGDQHNKLIVFDQLYGGTSGDRYCTYGTATHQGVTVVYNNK